MKLKALATDYHGTIAHDGIVDQTTVNALTLRNHRSPQSDDPVRRLLLQNR